MPFTYYSGNDRLQRITKFDGTTFASRISEWTYLPTGEVATIKTGTGTVDKTTDGKGKITDYTYDALKRLTSVTQDFNGTDITTANAITQLGYDAQDNLISVKDANNAQTSYVYDDLGNMLSETSAHTGTTTYTQDAAGNIKTRKTAKNQTFTYTYDALNRVTLQDAPATNENITFAYDAMGHVTAHQSVNYSYDAAGQVSGVQLNRNGTLTQLISNATHQPFGATNSLLYGNGQSLQQTFNDDYRNGL